MRRNSFAEKKGSFNISQEDGSETLPPTDLQNKKERKKTMFNNTSYKNSMFSQNCHKQQLVNAVTAMTQIKEHQAMLKYLSYIWNEIVQLS
jgi:hypothetical protein